MYAKSNVLIVDDDEVVRLSHLRSLKNACCDIEAVGDGEDALRVMEQQRFDVVLLDLRMPGMDGMSVLRAIKQKWPESEVVVITGYPTIGNRQGSGAARGPTTISPNRSDRSEVINATDGAITRKKWALHKAPVVEEIGIGSSAGS